MTAPEETSGKSARPLQPRPQRQTQTRSRTVSWRVRGALVIFMAIAASTVWFTNNSLTHSFTETTRNRAELRLALYSGNLVSELRRHAIVPQLLSRDQALISALQSQDQYLAGFILLFVAVLTLIGMLVSDLLLAVLDPRIRLGGRAAS